MVQTMVLYHLYHQLIHYSDTGDTAFLLLFCHYERSAATARRA